MVFMEEIFDLPQLAKYRIGVDEHCLWPTRYQPAAIVCLNPLVSQGLCGFRVGVAYLIRDGFKLAGYIGVYIGTD